MKLIKAIPAVPLVCLMLLASQVWAGDGAVSGLEAGDPTLSFAVVDITGDYAGKRICYVCEFQDDPNILGFFQEANEETALLIEKLNDLYVANKDRNFKAVAVVVAGMDAKTWLEELNQEKGLEIPLVVLRKGQKDVAVRMYKLDPEVRNTFLVNINRLVKTNVSDVSPDSFGMVENAMTQMLVQNQ
jgi:hypothetical protein